MIWGLIIIVGFIIIGFMNNLHKDNVELNNQPLELKFEYIVKILNNFAFDGAGSVIMLDKRSFNLYEKGKNQIIYFHYSTGHLTIIWKYKYFMQEVILEKQIPDVRNLDISAQERIAWALIEEMESKVDVWTDVL
jgi:hypothetical protein